MFLHPGFLSLVVVFPVTWVAIRGGQPPEFLDGLGTLVWLVGFALDTTFASGQPAACAAGERLGAVAFGGSRTLRLAAALERPTSPASGARPPPLGARS